MEHPAHTSSNTEIITTRELDAHQELVFKAWSDPEHLKNWWGPKGFTNTFHEFDLQSGGKWRFTMHGPDKSNYENLCEFVQVVEPELLIWNHLSQPHFQVVTTFTERPGHKTELTFKMVFQSEAECEKLRPLISRSNEENFDRLEEELKTMSLENGAEQL